MGDWPLAEEEEGMTGRTSGDGMGDMISRGAGESTSFAVETKPGSLALAVASGVEGADGLPAGTPSHFFCAQICLLHVPSAMLRWLGCCF